MGPEPPVQWAVAGEAGTIPVVQRLDPPLPNAKVSLHWHLGACSGPVSASTPRWRLLDVITLFKRAHTSQVAGRRQINHPRLTSSGVVARGIPARHFRGSEPDSLLRSTRHVSFAFFLCVLIVASVRY